MSKNCLIVNNVEYSFQEVNDHVMASFSALEEEWYSSINTMTIDCFDDIVKSLDNNQEELSLDTITEKAWKTAVLEGTTKMSLAEYRNCPF